MTRVVDTLPSQSLLPPPEDPFRYGWRYVRRTGPDGREDFDMVPLTLEDVLHPQEDDCIPENSIQEQERRYLHDLLERRYAGDPTVLTLSDCLVDWGVPGLRSHSPDISVFAGVRDKRGPWSTFRLAKEGGRPLLVMEVVSPSTRVTDVLWKVDHYYRAGVPYYVIVDREREGDPARVIGYRATPDGYAEMALDEHGRLWLEVVGLWIGPKDGSIVCYDGATGEEIGDYLRVSETLEQVTQDLQAGNEARRYAEQRAAEEQARAQAAEQRAAEEQTRAQAAETRIRELEEEMRRLRGPS